jgi:hypothetical protein
MSKRLKKETEPPQHVTKGILGNRVRFSWAGTEQSRCTDAEASRRITGPVHYFFGTL